MFKQSYEVEFNGNAINGVPGVWLYNYNATNLPDRDINIYKLARRSLSIITSSEYTQKNVSVNLWVCSGGRELTEETITTIKGLLQAQNGVLKLRQSGIEVEYIATMNEFNIEWDGPNAYVTIVFIASTPIASGSDTNVLANISSVTTSSTSATFLVAGSYIAEPLITVVITSVTGGNGGSINLFNGRNNQGITITSNFANGDVITVDSTNYVVQINGISVDFTGIFPTFPPAQQQLAFSDTFLTRNLSITMTYNPRIV